MATIGMCLWRDSSIWMAPSAIVAIFVCAPPKWPIGRAEENIMLGGEGRGGGRSYPE